MFRTIAVLLLAVCAQAQERLAFQDDLWREFYVYRDRLLELARAIPEDKYGWRPDPSARSAGEVIMHVAVTNYMLLEMAELPFTSDLYPGVNAKTPDRRRAIVRRNGELEKEITGKARIIEVTESAFAAAGTPIRNATAASLDKPAMFGDRKTTVGGVQLRMVAHLHEHLGQLIAYARGMGIAPPWSR